jgi:hypothetical protein
MEIKVRRITHLNNNTMKRVIEITEKGKEYAAEGAAYKIIDAKAIEEKRLCEVTDSYGQTTGCENIGCSSVANASSDLKDELEKALIEKFPELAGQAISFFADGSLEVELLNEEDLRDALGATWDEIGEYWSLPGGGDDLANKFADYINFSEAWREEHETHITGKVVEWFDLNWKTMVIEAADGRPSELLDGQFVSPELEAEILADYEGSKFVKKDDWRKIYTGKKYTYTVASTALFQGIDVFEK